LELYQVLLYYLIQGCSFTLTLKPKFIIRQVLYLLRFNFTLKYVPGTKIEKADRLSRKLDWKVRVEKNNKNQKLIKEK